MFIQLCLMTVLLLPCVAFITTHNAQRGVGHPAPTTTADLWIQVSGSVCRDRNAETLSRCVEFPPAYLITSAWTEPDDALPAAQRVASPPACVDVGYVWWRLWGILYVSNALYTMMSMLIQSVLTFPIPGFSFTLDTARSRHGGAGGGETCRIPLKLVG